MADLHRPFAAQSSDLAHHPQLRIQRRDRNIHFHLGLHRGIRLWPGDARGRLCGGDGAHPAAGLADLCRACVPVHDLSGRDFLCRHQLRESALQRRDGHHGFSQAAGRHHCPGAAVEISSGQHGRAAALYRADVLPAVDPVADEVANRRHAGAVGPALCRHLAIRSAPVGVSKRGLGLQPVRLAIAVRVRRLVRAGRRRTNVADSRIADHALDRVRLPAGGVLRDADLVFAAAQLPDAALARAMDVPHRQDRSRRTQVCTFPGAGGRDRALPAKGLAGVEVTLAASADLVRAALAGDFLSWRIPGIRRTFHPGRSFRRRRAAFRCQYFRNPDHVRRRMAVFMVQTFRRQECLADKKHDRQCRYGRGESMRSGSRAMVGLMSLAGLFAASPLFAEDAAPRCEVPAYLLTSESTLSKVADAVKNGRPLDILVIGSRSSTIPASEASAYPVRLQAMLRERLPALTVNLAVELQPKKTAEDVVGGLAKLLEGKKPVLVVWQTGTVDAMRSVDPDDFRSAVGDGVVALQNAGADVVLMNPQYSPRTETMMAQEPYLDNMRVVAQEHDVPLFDRFAIMRQWNDSGEFDLFSAVHGIDLAKRVHDCLGRALSTFVIDAAHINPAQQN